MTRSKVISGSIAALAIFAGGVLVGQVIVPTPPPPKITVPANYGNMQDAQRSLLQAYDYLVAAQKANNDNLGGYAATAEQLIDQADNDILLAAEYAAAHNR
ncbi:MAG: hypothetical protein WCF30_14610 [Terracidiphilus sp.]